MDAGFVVATFWRLMAALPLTLEVWALSVLIGGVIAMGLTWMRVGGSKPLAALSRGYVFVFRGSPLLIQLFVIYYGLSSFACIRQSFVWPLLRDAFPCAVLSLALCTAAYTSEIFRGALAAVPNGQVEAARACGMSGFRLFRRVIFPIALRQALPAYSTEVISMTKATALVSLVTLWDMMSVALKIRNDTLVTYTPLLVAGAIYFVLNFLIARAFMAIEYRLSTHLRPRLARGPP
jgi:octopine/nopaline transport system permease protein